MPLERSSLKVFKYLPWRTDFPLLEDDQLEQLARQFEILNLINAIRKYELEAMDTELKSKQCSIKFSDLFDPKTDYPMEMRLRSYKLAAAFINPLCNVLTAYRVGDAVVRWCGQVPNIPSGVQLRASVPRHLTYPGNSKHWNHMKDLKTLIKKAVCHLDAYISHCNTRVPAVPVVNPVTSASHLTHVGARLMQSRHRIRDQVSFLTFVSNYEAVALGLNLAFQGIFDLESSSVVDAMRSQFDDSDSAVLEAIVEEIGHIKAPFLGALWIDPIWALSANAMDSFCQEEIMVASKCLGSYRPESLQELNRRLFKVFSDAARGRLCGVAIAKALRKELVSQAATNAETHSTFYRRNVDDASFNERLSKDHPTLYQPNPRPEREEEEDSPSVDARPSQTSQPISQDVDMLGQEIGRTVGASDEREEGELTDQDEGGKNAEKRGREDGEMSDKGESTAQVKRRKIGGNSKERKGNGQVQMKDVGKEPRSERRKDDDDESQENDSDTENDKESEEETTGNSRSTRKLVRFGAESQQTHRSKEKSKALIRIPPRPQESSPQKGKRRQKTQPPRQKAKPKAENSKGKRKTRQEVEDEEDEEEQQAQSETLFGWREIESQSLTRTAARVFAVDTLENPDGLSVLAPPGKRVNHITARRRFFNPDGSFEDCIVRFHARTQLEFFHEVADRISLPIVGQCQEKFGPLHATDPQQSMMHVLTEAQYKQYSVQKVHDILSQGKVIVVHGCQGRGMEFGLEQLSKLGPLDGPLYVIDQSEPFSKNYDEQGRVGTLRQFHNIVTGPDEHRRALNALSLPNFSPVDLEPALAQDQAIWNLSNILPVVHPSVFPADMKYWHIAGGGGATSPWHNDAHGYGTSIEAESGVKLFAFRCDRNNPEPSTSFINIRSQYKAGPELRVEGILVRPGVRLIMPPGIPHAAFTIHPAVCSGEHFYTWATMELTVHASMRSLILESIFTNTEEHAFDARQMLVRMMTFLYEEMILQGRAHDENPLLPRLEREEDWVALSAFFCLIKMLNILALDTYRPRGLGEAPEAADDLEKAHKDHDVNLMLTDERIGMMHARGIVEDSIDILSQRYSFDFRHQLYEAMLAHYLVYLKRAFDRTYRNGKQNIPKEGCLFDNPVTQKIFDVQVEWVARSREELGKVYEKLMQKHTSVPDMQFTDWEAQEPLQYTSYPAQRKTAAEYLELGMHEGDVRFLNMWNRKYREDQPDS